MKPGFEPIALQSLSRRTFLISSGAAAIAVAFGGVSFSKHAFSQTGPLRPNAWVRVGTDDVVTIYTPASEMGQGVMTTLPLLIAEEMDLDWSRVRVEQAPYDPKHFGNPLFGGGMVTGASQTTRGYYDIMRLAGKQAREIMMQSVARKLSIPAAELATEPHRVVHKATGRAWRYGEIAPYAEVPANLPKFTREELKSPKQFRLLGKDVPRIDVPDKVSGRATFGIDVRLPGMLYGTVLRAPVQGEKPEKIDDSAAKKVTGVCEGANRITYVVPNRGLNYLREQRGIDVGFWRGVGGGYTKFAIETLMDELAAAAGKDAVDYRLRHLESAPRARAVIEEAARMANWNTSRAGLALGIAYSDMWESHVAQVAEVSVDGKSGRIGVHEVWCAVDPGVALQPRNIAAQMESAIVLGLSAALEEKVTFKDGLPQQSNFHDYPVLRFDRTPRVNVKVMATENRPGGIGEVGLPPIAPAVANAVFKLTGKRLRALPFDENLLRA